MMIISCSKLPQRTLAEILASCAVMQDRKFELRVDEWKFVGHPFLLLNNQIIHYCQFMIIITLVYRPHV